MGRRGRNEGSIRYIESKKLYEARFSIGTDENGKSIYKSIYGKKKTGPGGVMEKMRDALSSVGKGKYVDPSNKTLYQWCKEWYETYKEPSLKANTKEKYLISLKRIEPSQLAKMRLKDINLEIIQKYYNKLKIDYTEETIKATHSLINGALNKAEEINMILKNPARNIIIPKDDEEGEIKALDNEQYEKFLTEMGKRSNYYMFALFVSNTGLRPGEAIALNRQDIDLTKKTVSVNKTYVRAIKGNQNSPKTKASKRIVPVPDATIKLMKEYMIKQKKQDDNDPLFQTLTGTRISPRNVLRQFKEVGKIIKCEWVNLHTLRHTYASRLFKEKVDVKVISKLLGHSKVSTTYDIYVHFINNIIEESVQLLNDDIKVPETIPEISRKRLNNAVPIKKISTT